MNKEAVAILSHADTGEKTAILKECIQEIKRQGYVVILSSHINVEDFIKNEVDYFIYDKENLMITEDDYLLFPDSILFAYSEYPGYSQRIFYPNHAYAILKLMKNACGIADVNEYQIIHFVNYDYILKDPALLKMHSHVIKDKDIVTYDSLSEFSMNTALFSVKIKPFMESIKKVDSKKTYCELSSINKTPPLELFLYDVCKHLDFYFLKGEEDLRSGVEIDKVSAVMVGEYIVAHKDDNHFCHVWLSKVEEAVYIWIWIQDYVETLFEFTISNTLIKLNPPILKTHLIKLTDDELEAGIDISIPSFNWSGKFDKKRRTAHGQITNQSHISLYSLTDFINTYKVED